MSGVLSFSHVVKTFDGNLILNGVSFEVERGQVVGLLGPNGAGKSTLLQVALGLYKADSGDAQLLGQESWELNGETKQKIGYVPQQPAFFEWMRVQQSIDYIKAFYNTWDDAKVSALLAQWELEPSKKISKLSLGQKQRLAIIQALGHQPDVLLLDEPVASLDPLARRQFIQELVELNADRETTILFSTHIVSDLERVASHALMLNNGKLVYEGELDALKESVVKVVLKAKEIAPKQSPFSNTLNYQVNGRVASATIQGLAQEELEAARNQFQITVQTLDLESIYMEMIA